MQCQFVGALLAAPKPVMQPNHNRRSIRLPNYDYSSQGLYFITTCIFNRECILARMSEGKIVLSKEGQIVTQVWEALPDRFETLSLGEFVVMPNHIHAILAIQPEVRAQQAAPLQKRPTLGVILRAFKSQSAVFSNRETGTTGRAFWQRNYYEHLIRTPEELLRIREYIINNPFNWARDKENPDNQALEVRGN